MSFPQPAHLNQDQISQLFVGLEPSEKLHVVRVRYKNKEEIRLTETMSATELRHLLLESILSEHLTGGDLEVTFPLAGQTLVGQHDGVFWLQPSP
jgi:hypothetical protein